MPRKSVYKEIIEPNLAKIKEALEAGSTEKAVYESLGVSKTAWCGYKKSNADFANLLAGARACAEIKIDNAIHIAACGYFETDVKTVHTYNKDGDPITETIETKKWHEPNMTAAAIWKRNNNKEFIDKDRTSTESKEREIKLREEVAKDKSFGTLDLRDEE